MRLLRGGTPPVGVGLAAAAVGALAHSPALSAGFLADDYILLTTLERFDGVAWAFTHNDLGEPEGAGHFYRPLWVLANASVQSAFGNAAAPLHAFNLALFAVVTLEVFGISRLVLDRRRAALAALAFALYPRHGESVAWISGNTDLCATALALAALLVAASRLPAALAVPGAAALAAGAACAKETAFLLPVLAYVLLRFSQRPGAPIGQHKASRGRRYPLAVAGAMMAALAAVFALRWGVLGELGGYGTYSPTPLRIAAGAASYGLAALSPPQLDVLRWPALAAVPVALWGLAGWQLLRLRGRGEAARLGAAVFGLVWFALALLPSLNLIVDLGSANGERLLFLPSVGLCVALAALAPAAGRGLAGAAAVLVLAGAFALDSARTWAHAGTIATRVIDQAEAVAPESGELLLLSLPESYETARVLSLGLDHALARRGVPARIAWCAPVQVLEEERASVRFAPTADGFAGETTAAVPFTFPLGGGESAPTPDCRYRPGPDGARLGRGLDAELVPAPRSRPVTYAFFDGRDVRPVLAATAP